MKTYTIIGGVNGVGKSSLTGVLRAEMTDLGIIIDVDKITAALGGDKMAGGRAALEKIQECLEKGVSFTQETTLAGQRTVKTAQAAKEAGYFVRLYYIGLDSAQESRERIQNRVRKGGHDIPSEDVERRFASRFADVARLLPYCDEATFYDNNNGFSAVGGYRNGELLPRGRTIPPWLTQLLEYLNP